MTDEEICVGIPAFSVVPKDSTTQYCVGCLDPDTINCPSSDVPWSP